MKYIKFMANSFYDSICYKIDLLMKLFLSFLRGYSLVAVWYAIVYSNSDILDSSILNNSIKYMIIVSSFNIIFSALPEGVITAEIKDGNIARQLLYPVNYLISKFYCAIGKICGNIISGSLPNFIFLTFIFNVEYNVGIATVSLFLVAIFIAITIGFLINCIIDLSAFWLYETFYFKYIRFSVISFFSGSLVPIWFYPEWLLKVIDLLPFKFMYYNPIAFFVGEIDTNQFLLQMCMAVLWIGLLSLICWIMWTKGIKRLTILGG